MQPDSPAVTSRLRAIAGPALCVRWHQNQAETVVKQWQEKIKLVKPRTEERVHTKPVQSPKKQDVKPDQALEDAQEQLQEMRRLLAELQEELKRQRNQNQGNERREKQPKAEDLQEDRKRQERERQEHEDRDREAKRQEEERQEKERKEDEKRKKKEQQERERQEKEQQEREQKAREQAAHNERIRQKAQKVREERERKEREKAQQERDEWDRAWAKYQDRWVKFRAAASQTEVNIRDAIPWPVKSGSYSDVGASAVEEFMQMAVPRDADTAKLMRKECQKWHPDMVNSWLRGAEITDVDRIMIGMICRVVTDVLNKAAGRSSEFLD